MSDGPPARPDDAVDARWLFPKERTPSPPRDEGCEHNGFVDPALPSSNGSPPTPSPPMSMSRCILPSHLTTDVVKIAITSTPQTTFSPSSSFGFSPSEDHSAAVRHFDGLISRARLAVAAAKELFESAVHDQSLSSVVNRCYEAWQAALALVRSSEEMQMGVAIRPPSPSSVTRWLANTFVKSTFVDTLLQRSRRRLIRSAKAQPHACIRRSPQYLTWPSAVSLPNVISVRLLSMPSWPRLRTLWSSRTTCHA